MLWLTKLLFTLWAAEWFSSVLIFSCVFKCCERMNFFSNFEQLNGFSSVWIISLVFQCSDWLYFFSNFEAAEWFFIGMNFFTFLQMLWLTDLFSHFEQLNGFSSVWIISRAFKCCDCQIHDVMKIFSCTCTHVAEKSREYDEQRCYQMCDKSSLYMYFKKLVFSGFSLPVEPGIRIFFRHNLAPIMGLILRPQPQRLVV